MAVKDVHLWGSHGLQEADRCLLRDVLRTQSRKFLANLPMNLVDSGHIGQEKQLLPDFFGRPVRDALDQRVQDSVPSVVVRGFDPFMFVQLRDHVGGRIKVF